MSYTQSKMWMEERCPFTCLYAQLYTGLCSRYDLGRVTSQIAALWQTLGIRSLTGRMLVCASMTSVTVVHNVPMIDVTAVH